VEHPGILDMEITDPGVLLARALKQEHIFLSSEPSLAKKFSFRYRHYCPFVPTRVRIMASFSCGSIVGISAIVP
jgi:hypothetical protein